jgi:sodium/bile acid cotransporter 7
MATWADWFDKNFLMVGLCCSLLAGLIYPPPGIFLHDLSLGCVTVPRVAVVVIFLVSGLGLDSPNQWNKPKPLIMGIVFVLFVTPLVAIPVMMLPEMGVPIEHKALLQGMSLFCAVPTTLASGVTMVKQANGNWPLAVVLTTVTNLLGVFTMPFSMSWIFAANVRIDPTTMLNQLIVQTLVPLALGILLRMFVEPLRKFATTYKKPLSKTQNCMIFLTVWIMTSSAQSKIVSSPPGDLGVCIALAIVVHIIYRFAAYWTATVFRLPEKEWLCFVLMCSQKSLPVCVSVLSALPPALRSLNGVLIIPCILSHFSQLMIDGFLAVRWTVAEAREPLLSVE